MSEALRQGMKKNDGKEEQTLIDGDKDKDAMLYLMILVRTRWVVSKIHDCAKKVNYKKEEWETIPEQHTMLEDGTVTHYDITNGEVILENVPVEELRNSDL